MPSKKNRHKRPSSPTARPKAAPEKIRAKGRGAVATAETPAKARAKGRGAVATAKTPAKARAKPAPDVFPIVGIGASAGGLEAVTQFLKHLPEKPGMAFVLVQHLDPTHESALTSLLSRTTSMDVTEAKDRTHLEPNRMYIIPPNKVIGVVDRRLRVSPRKSTKDIHAPIDHFLESLAEQEGSRSIGVILSGNGSDGTRGLLAIKAAGGITFAQDEKSAKYPGMPASAISAGCVDFVFPPERIARELHPIATHLYALPAAREEPDIEQKPASVEKLYEDIFVILRQRVGVDFTFYKRPTIHRRIQRRMTLHKINALKDYVEYLRSQAAEVQELFNDILIHVTGFFRDRSVFQALAKKVYPRLLKNRRPEDPIRVWVPGCSSGEEAYSIAMSLTEFLSQRKAHFPVQVFGTDINPVALEKARAGLFPLSIAGDVSTERLRRFFVKSEAGYRISKSIREMCIFARQNVVTDPPFSGLDLISCRNVLIYLGSALQRKVFPTFHYALKPNGLLLLGASETVGSFVDLFSFQDKKGRVYTKKSVQTRPGVTFAHGFVEHRPEPLLSAAAAVAGQRLGPAVADVQKQADRLVLSQYSPAGVVINRHLEVVQFRGRTGLFIEHAHGEASLNLLKMAREGLVVDLRTAINKAVKTNARVRIEGVRFRQNKHFETVHLEVVPFHVPPAQEHFYLVVFEPAGRPRETAGGKAHAPQKRLPRVREAAELHRLRDELSATRESLQAIIEEQDATNEELRSANEEIMSSNEELQSTNEELETAKEELQSTNEELTTLNDELESRNTELEQVNNDLHNLMASVNIPIVMVGQDLRIRRFTAIAEKLLNLIPADVGRPITDIKLSVDVPDLDKLVAEVIDTLQTREVEVQSRQGNWWSVRIRPYKTADHKIDGAVVAMLDINLLKEGMERMNRAREFTQAMLNTIDQPLLVLNQELVVESVNEAFCRLFHAPAEKLLSRSLDEITDGEWNIPRLRMLLADALANKGVRKEAELEHESPHLGRKRFLFRARSVRTPENEKEAVLLVVDELPGR